MKAMSLGLVRGKMDEPSGVFIVEWVQPRVLNPTQLNGLASRISEWQEQVTAATRLVMQGTNDWLVPS